MSLVNADDLTSNQYSTYLWAGWQNYSPLKFTCVGQDEAGSGHFVEHWGLIDYPTGTKQNVLEFVNLNSLGFYSPFLAPYLGAPAAHEIKYHYTNGAKRITCFHDVNQIGSYYGTWTNVYI